MTANGWTQIAIFAAILLVIARPLGGYMTAVFEGRVTFLRPVERVFYTLCGTRGEEQHWLSYGLGMLLFHVFGFASLYALQRLQNYLPFNPQDQAAISPDSSFNTAVSFTTNTNWQSYTPESTMSYLTQMAGLTVHNFVSAAAGIVLSVALIRGFARRSARTIGNFWVDMTRCVLYILLPLSIVGALLLTWQGVPQNLSAYTEVTTVEGAKQIIAQGPVASQEIIKELGTNGGGFFNANSAHPFENPTPLSNLIEMVAIFAIGVGLTNVFGRMVGNEKQGWALLAAMGILFFAGVATVYWAEAAGNPQLAALGVDVAPSAMQAGGNMEGKEVRFGIANSALWATITTDTSCGAVNSMHDSYMPFGGMVPLINMLLGEVIVGGVGSGLYGILLFAIVALFVAGLMVGRTPEYLGKKLEAKEVKMTMLAILCLPLSILLLTAIAVVIQPGLTGISNAGPHGFSEVLYAFTEGTANNGSAFAGLSANTPFYNTTIGLAMLIGRFFVIIPMLAIAGALAAKNISPPSAGTFPTDSGLFVGLLVGVIAIVGGLTYFPAVALGPLAEQFAMQAGTLY
ncbi:MAG: potassium-transporting ATPase subunit KdpA [Alphaproteobacteria bacterium]|nr:potassium-transporting ATPase subunit KdpA [Alphaproteobacteria bacterium]